MRNQLRLNTPQNRSLPSQDVKTHNALRLRFPQALTQKELLIRSKPDRHRNPLLFAGPRTRPGDETYPLYTDGHVSHPKWPEYALAGASVWEHGASDDHVYAPLGLSGSWDSGGKVWMHSPVAAYHSSTRAEIVAGLLACMKHKCVTIYTDSKAFMIIHRRVCAKISGDTFQRDSKATISYLYY